MLHDSALRACGVCAALPQHRGQARIPDRSHPASRGLRKQVGDFWSQVEKISVGGLSDQERQTVLRVIENMEERLSERRSVDQIRKPAGLLARDPPRRCQAGSTKTGRSPDMPATTAATWLGLPISPACSSVSSTRAAAMSLLVQDLS